MNLHERVAAFLKAQNWTHKQLAKAIGIHPTSLSRLINEANGRNTAYEKLERFLATPTPAPEVGSDG